MPTGTLQLTSPAPLHYGDEVTFVSTVSGRLAAKSRLYVTLVAVQDDGEVVYQYSKPQAPTMTFQLTDQIGLDWDGGAAEATAVLIYRVDRREDLIVTLDTEKFSVLP